MENKYKHIQPILADTSQTVSDIFIDWPPPSYLDPTPVWSKANNTMLEHVREDASGRTILYRGKYKAVLSDKCDVAMFDVTPEAPLSSKGFTVVPVTHNSYDISIKFDGISQRYPINLQVMLLGLFGFHRRGNVSLHTLFNSHSSRFLPSFSDQESSSSEPKPATFVKEFHLPMCCYDHRTAANSAGGFRLLSHLCVSTITTYAIKASQLLIPDVCFKRCPLNSIPDREAPDQPRGNILKCPFTIRHKSEGVRDMGLYILISASNLKAEPTEIAANVSITSRVEAEDYWPNSFVFNEKLGNNGMHSAIFK